MEDYLTPKRKLFLVVGLFVFLLVGVAVVRIRRTPTLPERSISEAEIVKQKEQVRAPIKEEPGILSLSPNKPSIAVGEEIRFDVLLTATGKVVSGADAVLLFDPSVVEIIGIDDGSLFQSYPRKTIDVEKGKIAVTGFRATAQKPLTGQQVFFRFRVRGKRQGTADIGMEFMKGKTNASTIVEQGTSQNILGTVESAILVVKAT